MEGYLAIGSFTVLGVAFVLTIRNFLAKISELEKEKFLANFDYDGTKKQVNIFLNAFIADCMQDYIMYHIVPDSALQFIDTKREERIRDDLEQMVAKRLSNTIRDKIILCYSSSYLGEILAEKIFFVVTMYVADFNKQKKNIHTGETKRKTVEAMSREDEFKYDW